MNDFKKQAEKYAKAEQKLQVKYGVKRNAQIIFPNNKKANIFAKFALWILRKNKAEVVDGLIKFDYGSIK